MMWHALKAEVLSLKHRPSHWYLEIRQECMIFKRVLSHVLVIFHICYIWFIFKNQLITSRIRFFNLSIGYRNHHLLNVTLL